MISAWYEQWLLASSIYFKTFFFFPPLSTDWLLLGVEWLFAQGNCDCCQGDMVLGTAWSFSGSLVYSEGKLIIKWI